jgi:hypothetical protein
MEWILLNEHLCWHHHLHHDLFLAHDHHEYCFQSWDRVIPDQGMHGFICLLCCYFSRTILTFCSAFLHSEAVSEQLTGRAWRCLSVLAEYEI